jgi:ribosome biogenesis GTPase / thiamine phosphate phosphatase
MDLTELGWDSVFASWFAAQAAASCAPARVCEESHGLYRARGEAGEWLCELAGRVRFAAVEAEDLPAVGDWVVLAPLRDGGRATITGVLPRRTALARKAAGQGLRPQVLAANLDTVFVVSSLNQELSLRRLERYLAVVWESGAQPVVLLNKADLYPDPESVREQVERVAAGAPVHAVSAMSGAGLARLWDRLGRGRTAAFVGSSGVGKSTLVNALLGHSAQRTAAVRAADDRGRHTTSARQLLVLPRGGVVIDTPGLRELQLWESDAGLARAFDEIDRLARGCRFRDCRHRGEPGCAVAGAIESGALPRERLDHHRKLAAELAFLAARSDAAAQRERKRRAKRGCKVFKRESRQRLG